MTAIVRAFQAAREVGQREPVVGQLPAWRTQAPGEQIDRLFAGLLARPRGRSQP